MRGAGYYLIIFGTHTNYTHGVRGDEDPSYVDNKQAGQAGAFLLS